MRADLEVTDPMNRIPPRCAVCGVACLGMAINNAYLCNQHFSDWAAQRQHVGAGGMVDMANFVQSAKDAHGSEEITSTIRVVGP